MISWEAPGPLWRSSGLKQGPLGLLERREKVFFQFCIEEAREIKTVKRQEADQSHQSYMHQSCINPVSILYVSILHQSLSVQVKVTLRKFLNTKSYACFEGENYDAYLLQHVQESGSGRIQSLS